MSVSRNFTTTFSLSVHNVSVLVVRKKNVSPLNNLISSRFVNYVNAATPNVLNVITAQI